MRNNQLILEALRNHMATSNLEENCEKVANFFRSAHPADLDAFVEYSDQDFLENIRSHAIALKINQDEYIKLLKQNDEKYKTFVDDMQRAADTISELNTANNLEK